MNNESKNLSRSFLWTISIASLLSIAITCFIAKNFMESREDEIVKVIAADIYDDINTELIKPIIVSRAMANDSFLHYNLQTESSRSLDEQTKLITNFLGNMKSRFNYSAAFLVSEGSKNYWQPNGLIKTMDLDNDAHDVWYKDFVAKNVDYAFNVDTDEANKLNLTVFVNTRIKDNNNNLLGVCGVGVGMSNLQKIINLNEKNYRVKINLVDNNGLVQVDTESINIENATITHIISNQKTEQFFTTKINERYVLTKYIPAFDWYLVIQRDEGDMQSSLLNFAFYISIIFLIALMIILWLTKSTFKYDENLSD